MRRAASSSEPLAAGYPARLTVLLPQLNVLLMLALLWPALFVFEGGQAFASPFLSWMDVIQRAGLPNVFRVVEDKYGPNTYVTLFVATLLSRDGMTTPYVAFKVLQFAFSVGTYVAAYAVSRSTYLSLVLVLLLATNSILFASVDIYFTPFLILAFWALANRRYLLFSSLYTIASLFKYQPLIFLPIVAATIARFAWHDRARLGSIVARLLIPVVVCTAGATLTFGPDWFGSVFSAVGTNTTTLSAYAFNAQWLVSLLLEARDGSLVAQHFQIGLRGSPVVWAWLSRLVLAVYWVWLVRAFVYHKFERETLFMFLALTYLGYFMLATNVQINHLHAAVVPLFLAAVIHPRWRPYWVYWGIMLSLNLLVAFVWAPAYTTVVGGFDVSMLLALVNCGVFGLTAWASVTATS